MSTEKRPLKEPPSIDDTAQAQELIRFWIADNMDHVSLRVGEVTEPEKEPTMWGFILADIAKHVTDAFKELHPDGPEKDLIIKEIVTGFLNRIQYGPKSPGQPTKMGD